MRLSFLQADQAMRLTGIATIHAVRGEPETRAPQLTLTLSAPHYSPWHHSA